MFLKKYIPLLCLLSFVSCSGLVEKTRKSLLGDESPRKNPEKAAKWVSKSQYDDLMAKYKTVNEKYEKLKDDKYSQGKTEFDQVADMQKPTSSTETVDVFGSGGISNKAQKPTNVTQRSLDEELGYYKKAVALKENKKSDEALKIFQFLENSSNNQIQVRSKRHIGEIYLANNQFDLALQVFEGIIKKHAFSGTILKALEKASFCAGKLGLTDKQAQYESLLRDVFESQV